MHRMTHDSESRLLREALDERAEKATRGYYLTLACVGLGIVGLVLIALFPEQAWSLFAVKR